MIKSTLLYTPTSQTCLYLHKDTKQIRPIYKRAHSLLTQKQRDIENDALFLTGLLVRRGGGGGDKRKIIQFKKKNTSELIPLYTAIIVRILKIVLF